MKAILQTNPATLPAFAPTRRTLRFPHFHSWKAACRRFLTTPTGCEITAHWIAGDPPNRPDA